MDSQRYLQGAWGDPEEWGVWTHGQFVDLVLWPENPAANQLSLQVHLRPFLQNVSRQRLSVSANGAELGFFSFSRNDSNADRPRLCELRIPIAAGELPWLPLRISFTLLDLPSAESLGLPPGAPILGMGFLSARITRAE